MVAPYWSDVDIRREGSVYYRVVTRDTQNVAANNSLRIVDDFLTNYTRANFTSSWMLVATWEDVHPYPHGAGYSADSRVSELPLNVFSIRTIMCYTLLHVHTHLNLCR